MTYNPRGIPLTLAEQQVDYLAHLNHILERRRRVEQTALPAARKLAYARLEFGVVPTARVEELADRLARPLGATVRFGHAQARREILAQRNTMLYEVPDAGRYGEISRQGLPAVLALVRERSLYAARLIGAYVATVVVTADQEADLLAAVLTLSARRLHNHVLELVGEALNLGRSAGAYSLPQPPEFALRSEVLDKRTCDTCSREHGGIYQIGTTEYWEHMPPAHCLGGGRCRGIYVFGDEPEQVRQPEAA